MSKKNIAVILVAAGMGTRLGSELPKAMVAINNLSLIEQCVLTIRNIKNLRHIIISVPNKLTSEHKSALEIIKDQVSKLLDETIKITYAKGGDSRFETVQKSLDFLDSEDKHLLIHDAARPGAPLAVFESIAQSLLQKEVAIPVISIADTVIFKDTESNNSMLALGQEISRDDLYLVQTPQGVRVAEYRKAVAKLSIEEAERVTDDASIMTMAGYSVSKVPGSYFSHKLTTMDDYKLLERVLQDAHPAPNFRIATASDTHAFSNNTGLWLGGLYWPESKSLEGHSDGDAVAHAIVDALLLACGLGDIGTIFGTDKPEYANARGVEFITATKELMANNNWKISSVNAQIIAAKPKINSRAKEIETHLTKILDAPFAISATTTDGLGYTGRAEGITVISTAVVYRG